MSLTSSKREYFNEKKDRFNLATIFVFALGKLKTKSFLIFVLIFVYSEHVVKRLQSVNLQNNCKENLLLYSAIHLLRKELCAQHLFG